MQNGPLKLPFRSRAAGTHYVELCLNEKLLSASSAKGKGKMVGSSYLNSARLVSMNIFHEADFLYIR